ncbi:phosphatidylcholine-sterol acyltransferase (lecithin-cholesterol acyltransferase)/ Phospholipase A [Schistosoma mansoni]|uniref:phosphatidylcholine-sterol acyltransferase (lecithin-cholesterol acyltransferase)/ Phospholipase A n=1 Tax=Schistosoma mansoni TaxID=6183 RepID=UPI0001A62279|nr:phosphatidylcholine-sterol acyltransferase (lecithin-cholesterol acyltransferase)/ Phospholipase A [Schistosoma mansoni]|eukprot:XP_018644325.1 phosphatidylcholine-sterol acyltransferase (lecithin-cholesterol acyltransferase)/ Phospholipase A [Schistosoma mansoni]
MVVLQVVCGDNQICFFFSIHVAHIQSEKYPIVIIPGDGGCQAYSKLKNSTSPPFLVWIDLRYFLEPGKLNQYFGCAAIFVGDNFGVFLRSPLSFRPVQRTLPSLAFLLPDSRLWSPTEPLIITPTTNYSAHDYERFFRDVNYSIGFQMMSDSKSIIDTLEKPSDIDEIYCIHGANLSTTDKMIYSPPNFFHGGFPDQVPTLIPGNGDGTVSLRSLEVCKRWPGIKYFVLPGAEHVNIMGDPRFIDIIRQIVGANTTKTLNCC